MQVRGIHVLCDHLHRPSPELSHLPKPELCTLQPRPLIPSPQPRGTHHSTFRLYEFGYSRSLLHVESYSICPVLPFYLNEILDEVREHPFCRPRFQWILFKHKEPSRLPSLTKAARERCAAPCSARRCTQVQQVRSDPHGSRPASSGVRAESAAGTEEEPLSKSGGRGALATQTRAGAAERGPVLALGHPSASPPTGALLWSPSVRTK